MNLLFHKTKSQYNKEENCAKFINIYIYIYMHKCISTSHTHTLIWGYMLYLCISDKNQVLWYDLKKKKNFFSISLSQKFFMLHIITENLCLTKTTF